MEQDGSGIMTSLTCALTNCKLERYIIANHSRCSTSMAYLVAKKLGFPCIS